MIVKSSLQVRTIYTQDEQTPNLHIYAQKTLRYMHVYECIGFIVFLLSWGV